MSSSSGKHGMLRVEVLYPFRDETRLDGVKALTVRLEDGSLLGILPGHAPLIAATADGILRYTDEEGRKEASVRAGILTVRDNLVSILTTF